MESARKHVNALAHAHRLVARQQDPFFFLCRQSHQ